jgi:Zn-dependent protease with chaperone function
MLPVIGRLRARSAAACSRAARIAVMAVLSLAVAISAAVMLAAWLLPSDVLIAAATYADSSPDELDYASEDRLYRIVRGAEALGMPDLPLRVLGWGDRAAQKKPPRDGALAAAPSASGSDASTVAGAPAADVSAAELAHEAHMQVLAEHGGEWHSSVQSRRLNALIDALAAAAGDPPGSYTVTLLNSAGVNAFSTADGRLHITRGLVTTSTDDELAVVLAHEMHHIRSGHWVDWWELSQGLTGDASDDVERGRGGSSKVQRDAQAALAALGALASDVAVSSYDQEYESDAAGAISAARCGFDASSIYRSLTRLPEMPVTSHPPVALRIERATQLLAGMDMGHWQSAFGPVQVAVGAVKQALDPVPGGVRGMVSGMDELAGTCRWVLGRVRRLEEDMLRWRWLGRTHVEDSSRVVGRLTHSGSALAVVDIGVNTGMGRETVGTPAQKCGRVWMARIAGVWIPVLAQTTAVLDGTASEPISEWLNGHDELGGAWRRRPADSPERAVLRQAAKWRDTAVTDFGEHLDVYARGRLEQSLGAGGINGEQPSGALEAMGWAQYLAGRRNASWTAWDVEVTVHSETLATVAFASAISAEGIVVASANISLTLGVEDGLWKVLRVSWN